MNFFFYFVYNWEKNELTDHICSCDLEADLGLVSQYKQGHTVSSRWYWCLKLKFQARAPCCPCIQFFFAQAQRLTSEFFFAQRLTSEGKLFLERVQM